ncbi:potassium voltage-gated channel Shaw-related subfamily C member 1 [Fistulifera solaris]|uniref:Potassium voltage-gated channel Shaw-related subfamily C member 1 n=1 Tax=Fistulifera solaris TaxID=1519565 RepID=A0A1Z5J9P5_FISSO|nr:potassium voltage-gated channel Shaw-related subfamily C member 1 [Fistulifera solaris]|eukprot:GAX10689.1 potassium voltage-gated channel Shaw-related subfamily C member 1 [Fistulifera solaris]
MSMEPSNPRLVRLRLPMTTNMATKKAKRSMVFSLDVGGTLYKVSRTTLERCKGTRLAQWIADHEEEKISEALFIDRNGMLFQYVLDYLRTNKLLVPPSVSRAALREEFAFYGIPVDITKIMEKYSCEYLMELKRKISAKRSELSMQRKMLIAVERQFDALKANLDVMEREARAIQASAYFERVALNTQLTAHVCVPLDFVPFDMDTLVACSQLKGLNLRPVPSDGYGQEYLFRVHAVAEHGNDIPSMETSE